MGLFYSVSDKELLNIRNKIFLERGIPALYKNGFKQSPIPGTWFGRNNLNDFTYELCRLGANSRLEMLTIHISRGGRYIKIFLNIFELKPDLNSLNDLNEVDGIQFYLPPNTLSEMRLRADDYKVMPLIYMFFGKEHKIGCYNSNYGLKRKIRKLGKLIEEDMTNIDSFIKRWYEMHQPLKTTWEGIPIGPVSI